MSEQVATRRAWKWTHGSPAKAQGLRTKIVEDSGFYTGTNHNFVVPAKGMRGRRGLGLGTNEHAHLRAEALRKSLICLITNVVPTYTLAVLHFALALRIHFKSAFEERRNAAG